MNTLLDHGKLCKILSKYVHVIKKLLPLYENILVLTRSFGVVALASSGKYAKRTSSTQYMPIQVQ